MLKKDVEQCHVLFIDYMKKFSLAPLYSKKEFGHWCLPKENVIYSYVVEDPETKKITDFASFYNLPSSIIGNKNYTSLKAAYLFYYAATKTKLSDLIDDILIMARDVNFIF
jgi:glycylpeptide N-tetradecanoyltransferase